MHLSPDQVIFWQHGVLKLNLTIAATWTVMALLVIGSRLITRRLSSGIQISRWQTALEIVIGMVCGQMADMGLRRSEKFLGFIGTLFLFIATANLCAVLPLYEPPTGSLSTTAALAICVFVAVPAFGISERGLFGWLKSYLEPTFLMLPFHLLSDLTRTLALAVRLFGNMMSGTMILAILLSVAPLFFPVLFMALGLITGLVQAYIFTILAIVYIAAATRPTEGQTTR
ncbi:MAG: F0F1 ATP synthase subunit A [Verrucomicrobiota bacterium]